MIIPPSFSTLTTWPLTSMSALVSPGVTIAALGTVMVALQTLLIRIWTDEGRANDALLVVLFVNVLTFVPATAVLYFPEYPLVWESLASFVGAGFAGTLLGRLFVFMSIERIGASRSEPVKASQPLHATLIAVLVLHEAVTPAHMAGILLVVGGVATISWETTRDSSPRGSVGNWRDLLLPLAAALFYGIEPILAKIGFATGTPTLVGLTAKTVSATAFIVLYLRFRHALPSPASLVSSNTKWYGLAGLANTGFLMCYYAALEVADVSVVVPIIQTSPLVVLTLSYTFLSRRELVTKWLAAGTAIVVAGAILVTLSQ